MKIIILSYWFLSYHLGGSGVATYNYAKYLAQRGHEVHVITQWDKEDTAKFEPLDGFYIHRIRKPQLRFIGTLLYSLLVYRKVKKLLPDIIHEQAIQGIGFLVKKFLNTPYVVSPRAELSQASNLHRKFFMKPIFENADAILALTEHMAKEIEKFYPKRAVILPNGVDLSRFEKLSKEIIRQKLGLKSQEKIILCVGHLRPVKGIEYLIEAMNDVVNEFPDVHLYLVGRDDQRGKLQRLAQERNLQGKVAFTGLVSPDRIPEYMAAADIFVLPSLSEGFPNVLLEAEAAGLPIVATNVGGIPEIVKEGENGFLVPTRDSRQLAEKIRFLLQNEGVRKHFSSNNIEKARSYNWPDIITSLEEVYLKVKKR